MQTPPQLQAGETAVILAALQFTVEKHIRQMNGEPDNGTYINRRIVVTEILSRVGRVTDITTLTAAILHHVFDDTLTVKMEFDRYFGTPVRLLVQELAEDKTLSEPERMQAWLDRVQLLSPRAKEIIVAEKICKLQEISKTQPEDWSFERTCGYMTWLEKVVAGCRGVNPNLDHYFDELFEARTEIVLRMEPASASD